MIGGTGRIGQPVVRALVNAGHQVRVLTRDPARARALFPENVEWCAGDLRQPESIAAAMKDQTAVYINLPETTDPNAAFVAEKHGVENILRAVPRDALILKLSEIDAAETPHFHDLTFKFHAEEQIRASGNPYLIFRPTWFMESIPLVLLMKQQIMVVGKQPSPLYWIAARDFASQVVTALAKRKTIQNRTLNVQGAEAITFTEAARRYASVIGGGVRVTHLPLWVLRLSGLFSPAQKSAYELMAHYDRRRETFISTDTWSLLGKPTTTIEQFAAEWSKSSVA